jgi:DNA-binding HxlR family transcriptional regulator
MPEIIQGNWDDLVARQDLHGRKVQVIVMEEERGKQDNPWLKSLWAWADSHRPLQQLADDSRESIYSGTLNDPR